jgi:hypothetical protein
VTSPGPPPLGLSHGLDLTDLEHTSPAEIDAHLLDAWSARQPLYTLYATSLMTDYAPTFAKLSRWASDLFASDSANVLLQAVQNMHSYMMQGWETGIRNTFHTLHRNGLTTPQIMEIVLFAQLYTGLRGLGHVSRAAGDLLPVMGAPPRSPVFPAGWAADPDSFHCGLDFSTREMTPADVARLTAWYERTIGYLPNSVRFALKYHPRFVKVHRAKWEVAIKTLPKQIAPYLLIRHHMTERSAEGLREAVLLARAWGISDQWISAGIINAAMYFTGTEGLALAHAAVDDLL